MALSQDVMPSPFLLCLPVPVDQLSLLPLAEWKMSSGKVW